MPGVPRPVLDLPAQLGTIRLKPASLDNTSCVVRNRSWAAQRIHMRPGNTCRAAGGQQSTTCMDVLRGALASSLFMHQLPGQRIHRAQALPLGIVRHRTPPIAETKSPGQGRGFSLQLVPETGAEPATYAKVTRQLNRNSSQAAPRPNTPCSSRPYRRRCHRAYSATLAHILSTILARSAAFTVHPQSPPWVGSGSQRACHLGLALASPDRAGSVSQPNQQRVPVYAPSSQGPSTILPRHTPSIPGATTMILAVRSPSDPVAGIPSSRTSCSLLRSSSVPVRLSLKKPSASLLLKSTNILSSDIYGLCSLSTAGTGLDTVGENNRLAASGSSPTTVACVGETPPVEMTSPPAALTCPTVETPT
ncbi:hypothetical protein SAMN02744784_01159 [Stenotrophomonas sp. CC120223-11]|nr:hypothetical protein SAMN02744784_01159 [Stenotrophomonas sp. CC120223-11]